MNEDHERREKKGKTDTIKSERKEEEKTSQTTAEDWESEREMAGASGDECSIISVIDRWQCRRARELEGKKQ